MTNENTGKPRTEPVRIIRMTIAPTDPRAAANAPLAILAEFDRALPSPEQFWWLEQLREQVKVLGGQGSPAGMTAVRVEAPPDQVEAVARRLLTAVEEANASRAERYPVWQGERDHRIAEERLRQQRRLAAPQAILDRVMQEYRSNP